MSEAARRKKYDYVFLDILARAGQASGLSNRPKFFIEAFKSTVARLIAIGAEPIILEFYRGTVDPNVDEILPAVQGISREHGIKCWDLAAPMRDLADTEREQLRVDTVHTTAAGAARYAVELSRLRTH